jgi:hypothetical protein
MASLVLNGSTSGSITISSPSVSGSNTLSLPASTGTVVVTSGAQTIEFADGSASTPSITNSGDTNTGIFFPAADTIAFAEGGAEAMRIDSSGNVGIGTTSPTDRLDINGSSNTSSAIRLRNQGTNIGYMSNYASFIGSGSSNDFTLAAIGALNMVLATNGAERMRITDAGEVWIAGTTDRGAFNLQCNGTGVWGAGAYTNGSDARIKDDIQPITSSLEVVNKLNPVTFKYKEDWSKDQSVQTGFIAQELQETLKDEIYIDGLVSTGGEYLSVAYQNIIPLLTKAIQEQQTIIETLKSDIAELKAKVNV